MDDRDLPKIGEKSTLWARMVFLDAISGKRGLLPVIVYMLYDSYVTISIVA